MARNYAALPHEYWEEMADLTDEEWGRLTRALLHYSMTGEECALSGNERFFWRRVVNREHRFQVSFQEMDQRRSESARKAAMARWHGEDTDSCGGMPTHAHHAESNSETDSQTKAQTKTKPYSKSKASRATARKEAQAAGAAEGEQLFRDVLKLEEFTNRLKEGGSL